MQETSLEFVAIGDDGVVQSICEQPVFGVIKDMAILPWNKKFRPQNSQVFHDIHPHVTFHKDYMSTLGGNRMLIIFLLQVLGKDLLVIISDSGKLSFLTFSNEMHRS